MPGPRQPLALLEAKGAKHLSKKEAGERAAREVRVDAPKQIRPPEYLPESLREEFKALGKQLKDAGLLTALDFDNLARYLLARQSYLASTGELRRAQNGTKDEKTGKVKVDYELVDLLSRTQERFFKQCRNCANDMGLTVTSRCRLVLPEGAGGRKQPESEFERLMREREERRNRA